MSEIVFVLGAGASKHCGTPLMDNFLNVARDLLRSGEVEKASNAFNDVLDAVGELNAVHSKANLDVDNIESVYTAFEMGRLLGKLPGIRDEERIEGLTSAIRKVIGYTLEKTTKVPRDSRVNPFVAYYNFINIMGRLIKASRSFSVITFNYDLGLDYSLYKNALLPDYGLEDINLKGKSITCLKLHGSLNFGKCSNLSCQRILPYRQFQYTETKVGSDYSTIPILSKLKRLKCPVCGEPLEEDPLIIPPTWNKTAHHGQIDKVWRRAAHEMEDAEHIFVLGYSLPDTDWFFNYLYGLGVEMTTPVEGFYVYNPDTDVRGRFQRLLGPGVIQKFHYSDASFERAFVDVAKVLGL